MKTKILTFIFFFLIFTTDVNAASSYFTGNKSASEGSSGTVAFYVNGNGENVGTVGGYISSSNPSCIYITAVSGSSNNVSDSKYKFAYVDFSGVGFATSKHLTTVSYEVRGSNCSASITFTNDSSTTASAEVISLSSSSISISVLSADNTLSSLSTNVGNINFSSNVLNYSLSVDSDVSSVNVSASGPSTATISGTGTKNLSYGSNKLNVVVTAASGAKKTYTINITRKDDRSSDNTLKNLTVDIGTLSPEFSSKTTDYSLLIPFENDSVNIKATANDSKASVSISNTSGFISEETKDVIVTVKAENGSVKTYTIAVTRGKDPNKPLSSDNTLSSLSLSTGVLSPSFTSDNTDYLVWLPFEVTNIDIEFALTDTKWASYTYDKPDELSVGLNEHVITVNAEDGSERVYTINVMRGYSSSTNQKRDSYLASLSIINGKLNENFSSNLFTYTYSGNDIKIEAIANYEDSKVVVSENDGIYTIYVEDVNGQYSVYLLKPTEFNYYLIIIIVLISFVCLYLVYDKIIKKKLHIKPLQKTKKKIIKNKR